MAQNGSNLTARKRFLELLHLGAVSEPIMLKCEHCGDSVPSDMKWCCGYCGQENRRTQIDSFLNRCQRCNCAPTSYRCPNPSCAKVNFLDADKDATHPAERVAKKEKSTPVEDPEEKKRKAHEELKRDKERQIEILSLDVKASQLKGSLDVKKEKTQLEVMEDKIRKYKSMISDGKVALKRVIPDVQLEFKDDPKEAADIIKALEEFVHEETMRGQNPPQ